MRPGGVVPDVTRQQLFCGHEPCLWGGIRLGTGRSDLSHDHHRGAADVWLINDVAATQHIHGPTSDLVPNVLDILIPYRI